MVWVVVFSDVRLAVGVFWLCIDFMFPSYSNRWIFSSHSVWDLTPNRERCLFHTVIFHVDLWQVPPCVILSLTSAWRVCEPGVLLVNSRFLELWRHHRAHWCHMGEKTVHMAKSWGAIGKMLTPPSQRGPLVSPSYKTLSSVSLGCRWFYRFCLFNWAVLRKTPARGSQMTIKVLD